MIQQRRLELETSECDIPPYAFVPLHSCRRACVPSDFFFLWRGGHLFKNPLMNAKHGPVVSGCLLMLSQSTWAVAWPTNHNICCLVFTTVWTLLLAQSVPVELRDFSCSECTSAPRVH